MIKTKGAVYFQPKPRNKKESQGRKFQIKADDRKKKKCLNNSGRLDKYGEFITFNGRDFDVPFIMVRSSCLQYKTDEKF